VTKDWVQCPSCTVGLHRNCQQERAGKGLVCCPACQEGPSFTEEMNFFGIWFRNLAEERAFVSAAMGPPSPTINYLSEELYSELDGSEEPVIVKTITPSKPVLVQNKFSPINNYLAMQKVPRINSCNLSPTKIVKQFSPVKIGQHFSPAKQNSNISDASPHSSPLKNILEFVPRRSSRSSNSSSCSDVICDGSGSSRESSPIHIKPFNLPKMAKLSELKSPVKSKSPAKSRISIMGNSPKKLCSSPLKTLSSPAKVKTPTKNASKSPKKNLLISMAEQASQATAKPPETVKTEELVLNKPTTASVASKVVTPVKVNPKLVKKPKHRVVSVEYSSDSSEGPLSDIDDILTGNVPDVDKHPLANIVFDPANPFLDQVLERMSANDDEMSVDEAETSIEKKVKKKKKRRNDVKMSPRKSLLLKQTQDKIAADDLSPKIKPKKFGISRQLPLSERIIYHGRNWIPMGKFGKVEEEADCDCSWIFYFTRKRLEDITDVNVAEKTLMNMWNVHVAKYQGRGVMHLDKVLKDFLTEHSHTLIEQNLYRNFVSHISSMKQASLISMDTMMYCVNGIQEVMKFLSGASMGIGEVWKEQRNKQVEANMQQIETDKISKKSSKSSPRKNKSSTRGRPNSNLPGSSLSNCRSPSRGSPLSPSRPTSMSRGRRLVNAAVNVQKSLSFDPNNSTEISTQKFNEATPVKQKQSRTSPRKSTSTPSSSSLDLRLSDSTETGSSNSDSFHSTKEQELASFLNSFPKGDHTVSSTPTDSNQKSSSQLAAIFPDIELDSVKLPTDCTEKSSSHLAAIFPSIELDTMKKPAAVDKTPNTTDCLDMSVMIHALTEDPESDSEDELYFSPCTTPTPPSEQSTDTVKDIEIPIIIEKPKFLSPVYVRPRIPKDYKKLQAEEYERMREVAREKQVCQKVLVLYIDDSMIEKVKSLSNYINHNYNKLAQVMIEPLPLGIASDPKRKRAGSWDKSERSTPDLEVSFPLIDGSPRTSSYTSSPNSSNNSFHNCSGGKYGKKRKLRLNGDSAKHTQLAEELEKSAQLLKEVKSGIMRQATPTQDLMDI